MNVRFGWTLLKETIRDFNEDHVLRLSAALSYYAIFSIGPLLIITIGLAGVVMGEEAVRKEIERQLEGFIGEGAAKVVDTMAINKGESASLFATIAGLVALGFGATGVFYQLQDSLNTIWEVKAKAGLGVWGFVRDRFLSLTMVLAIGFLLLVSMVLSTVLSALTGRLGSALSISKILAHVVDFTVSLGVTTLLFAAIFKFLPDVKVQWRNVWVGAIGTAILFGLGKYLLGLYLGRESTASAYGAAGSVIIILLWFYYASVILFFGAEFTQVYAKLTGCQIVPSQYAVPVTEEERAQQGMPDPKKLEAATTESRSQPKPNPATLPHLASNMEPLAKRQIYSSSRVARPFARYESRSIWVIAALIVTTGLVAGATLRGRLLPAKARR